MINFIIVTGMSGAGKSRAIDALEDIGFYCVDNVPPTLIPKFAELFLNAESSISRLAVVTDIRGGDLFGTLLDNLNTLSEDQHNYKILYLEASDNEIKRRYKETRRSHPLAKNGRMIDELIEEEKKVLKPVKDKADYIIDTTFMSIAQLKERISGIFLEDNEESILINCISFGFKHGLPTESDLVFDVRCLPNPYYVEELKELTGKDQQVRDFVMESEQSKVLYNKITDMIDYLIPMYISEGKSQLTIAIGCTGGHHRSVTFAHLLYNHIKELGYHGVVIHRDILK